MAAARPRLLVLTDIGGDPDDEQSLVRLLVHANDVDLEGLVASAAGTPGELKDNVVRPDLIRRAVEAYGQVRPNLLRHDRGFPPADRLLGVIKSGNPHRGAANVGEGKDTEGSRFIIQLADRADPRPLDVAVWGGPTELAQALWRVRKDRSAASVRRFVGKLRVHAIAHQDDSGPWILENFPDLFYVLDTAGTDPLGNERTGTPDKRASVYRGMYLGGDESLTSAEWIGKHVREACQPLGALYPPKTWTAPNPHSALKEGDTPSWFYFLENGLQDAAHPEWGGWGGRFRLAQGRIFRDAQDTVGEVTDGRATVWRWRPAYQNELAARMQWCTKSVREANHRPVATLDRDTTGRVLRRRVRPGARVALDASRSRDPDGNRLSFRWWVYREAGSYAGQVAVEGADATRAGLVIPEDAAGKTVHVVLEISDDGSPPLTSYRRVVLEAR